MFKFTRIKSIGFMCRPIPWECHLRKIIAHSKGNETRGIRVEAKLQLVSAYVSALDWLGPTSGKARALTPDCVFTHVSVSDVRARAFLRDLLRPTTSPAVRQVRRFHGKKQEEDK